MLTRRFSIHWLLSMIFFATLWLILWRQLSGEWSVNDQYSYGWFVPLFAIILFWLRLEGWPPGRPPTPTRQSSSLQFGIIAVALILLFPIRLFEIANPDWRP